MILVAVMTIVWVSMMNKLYYGCQFWYGTILFSSNKLKYSLFSKISNEKKKHDASHCLVCLMGWEIRYLALQGVQGGF
jgi:hypothetical protein